MRLERTARAIAPTLVTLVAIAIGPEVTAQTPQRTGAATATTVLAIPAAGFRNDAPVGLFYRLKVGFSSGNRLEVLTLAFLPGNRITRSYPFGGAESFDQQRRCNPDMCGTYQLGANAISIRWDNNQASEWTYRRTHEGFELDGDSYKPARTFTTGTLVGTWAGAATTSNASQNSYVFTANGTFTFGTAAVRSQAGRYTLSGTALTLTWSDGTVERRTIFGASASNPVSLASIEGDIYRRQ